jgi:hypothetical protein
MPQRSCHSAKAASQESDYGCSPGFTRRQPPFLDCCGSSVVVVVGLVVVPLLLFVVVLVVVFAAGAGALCVAGEDGEAD